MVLDKSRLSFLDLQSGYCTLNIKVSAAVVTIDTTITLDEKLCLKHGSGKC
jgi:hypothetical protein